MIVSALALLCQIGLFPFIQDPFVVAPQAYKRQFENEWVRIVRVHYAARESIPAHNHPRGPTVYVYLTKCGQVRFKHTSETLFVVDRPPVMPGGFRLGYPARETHEIENLSDQSSDFLRVELKTEARDVEVFRGRFPPKNHSTSRSSKKTRFKNGQISIVRLTCAAQKECKLEPDKDRPWLLIAIGDAYLKRAGEPEIRLESGKTLWFAAGQEIRLENLATDPAEFLAIEFKTRPAN
jgi:quercetin dioxygenase-like cupin family protein